MSATGAPAGAEPTNAPGDLNGLEATLKAAVNERKAAGTKPTASATVTTQEAKTSTRPEYIPEKFWTGNEQESLTKMASAYSNLESAYGRMANDLGVQRKLTDRMLALDKRDQDMGGAPRTPAPKVDPRRLVDNPTETLDEYWKTREQSLRQTWEQEQQKRDQEARETAFVTRHPDYAQTASSPDFIAWANGDPFRAQAAVAAAQGDFGSADALLTQYKAQRGSASSQPNPNLEAARRAGTESSAQASEGGSKTSKRMFRRADLIQLKMEKPDVYQDPAFQAEIYQAYQEGRVK